KNNPEWLQNACTTFGDRLAEMWLALSDSLLKRGQPQQAKHWLERTIHAFPGTHHAESAQIRLEQPQGATPTRRGDFQSSPNSSFAVTFCRWSDFFPSGDQTKVVMPTWPGMRQGPDHRQFQQARSTTRNARVAPMTAPRIIAGADVKNHGRVSDTPLSPAIHFFSCKRSQTSLILIFPCFRWGNAALFHQRRNRDT